MYKIVKNIFSLPPIKVRCPSYRIEVCWTALFFLIQLVLINGCWHIGTYSLNCRKILWNVGHFEWRHLNNRDHTTAFLKAFPGKFTYVFSPKFTVCFSNEFHWKESSLFQLMVGWLMSNKSYQKSYRWRLNAQPGLVFYVLAPSLLSWAYSVVSTEQAWSLLSWSVYYLANCSLLSLCSWACPEKAPSNLMRQPNRLSVIFSMNTYNVYFRCRRPGINNTTKCAPVLLYTMDEVFNWTSDIKVTLTDLLTDHWLVLAGDFGWPGDAGDLQKKCGLGGWHKCPTDVIFHSKCKVKIFYNGDVFT